MKKIKLLMMPTIVVGLSACVTNTGSGPITLSSRVLSSYEHFKTLKWRCHFAVSEDGEDYSYGFCSEGWCTPDGNIVALNSCSNRSKKKCKIFADDTFILWKDASGRRITLQEASKGNSSRINYESKNRVTYICRRSLDVVFVRWDPDPSLAAYIQTAKERGLTPQRCAKLLGRDLIKDVSPTEEIVNTKNGLSKNLQERLKSLEDHGFITKDEAAVKRKAILEGL